MEGVPYSINFLVNIHDVPNELNYFFYFRHNDDDKD